MGVLTLDIKHLEYFMAVAHHKSFTKAAQAMHVSQPGLSKMIKNLEEELDVILLDRNAKEMALTDAGEILLQKAEKMIGLRAEISSSLYNIVHMKKGKIRIGIPPVVGTVFFAEIIAGFRERYPDITIDLYEQGTHIVEKQVLDGQLDLGVAVLPVHEPSLHMIPFIEEEMALLVSQSHHLADEEAVSLKDLKEEAFITFNKHFSVHDITIEACREQGFDPHIAFESSQWDFIGEMVGAKIGISILPKSICTRFPSSKVSVVSLHNPVIPWKGGIIYKKEHYLSYATREMIRYLEEVNPIRYNHLESN